VRILHVLTFVSANGAYGGPVAVAVGQTQALAELGHDVTLLAGWDGHATLNVPNVDVQLFRARQALPGSGFAGLCSPGVWNDVRRRAATADVVHVHLGRDMVSLPAAVIADSCGRPLIVQTHGMVRSDHRLKARAVDALLTRRVLQHSAAQLVLTDEEESDAPIVAGRAMNTVRVTNGVAIPELCATWDGKSIPEVAYCARLHVRKRPVSFVEMAAAFLEAGGVARFTIFGPDEGELPAVMDAIHAHGLGEKVKYSGALAPADVLPRLSQAQAYVLPSVNEPFPMSLLEAMSLALPSVITDSTGVSLAFESSGAAEITDGTPRAMAHALRKVLASATAWQTCSSRARNEIAEHYRADAVARRLGDIYDRAIKLHNPAVRGRSGPGTPSRRTTEGGGPRG
jgi:glycosyltransferase involved in cell wall biosynthesis